MGIGSEGYFAKDPPEEFISCVQFRFIKEGNGIWIRIQQLRAEERSKDEAMRSQDEGGREGDREMRERVRGMEC
jgi:hypothetical protein